MVTHPNIFKAVVWQSNINYLDIRSKFHSGKTKTSFVWKFPLWAGRAKSEEKWPLRSDFWSVKKELVVMWKWEESQERVFMLSWPPHGTPKALHLEHILLLLFTILSFMCLSPSTRMFLEAWDHIMLSLCLLMSGTVSFKCKNIN